MLPTDWLNAERDASSELLLQSGLQSSASYKAPAHKRTVPLVRPDSAGASSSASPGASTPPEAPEASQAATPPAKDSPPAAPPSPPGGKAVPEPEQPAASSDEGGNSQKATALPGASAMPRSSVGPAPRSSVGAGPSRITSRGALMSLQHMSTDVLLRLPMELGKQRGQPAKLGGFYKHEPLRMGLRTTNPPAVASAPAAAKSLACCERVDALEQGGAAAERYGGAASDGWSSPGTNSPSGSPPRPERRQQRGTRTGAISSSSLSHPRAGSSTTSRLADAKSDIVPRSDSTPASGQRPAAAARRVAQPRPNVGRQPTPDKENLRVRPASAAAAPAAAARIPARGSSRPSTQPTRPASSAPPADAAADALRGSSLRGPQRVPARGRPASAEDVVPRPTVAPPKRSAPPSASGARRPAAPSQASVARTVAGGVQQKSEAAKTEAPPRTEESPEKPTESSPSALKVAMESPGGSDALARFKAESAAAAARLEALAKKETTSDVERRKQLVLPDGGRGSGPPTIALAVAPAAGRGSATTHKATANPSGRWAVRAAALAAGASNPYTITISSGLAKPAVPIVLRYASVENHRHFQEANVKSPLFFLQLQ